MEMKKDPSNPNSNIPFRPSHHRRAHSELNFRIPNDLDLVSDPFDGSSANLYEIGSEDDIFGAYMDIDKFGSRIGDYGFMHDNADASASGYGGGAPVESGYGEGDGDEVKNTRPRHRHSNSVDGSSTMESIEAKKAMAPEKLAELWTLDPKRAKRILANRQSASRSKERKARYMSELERKVQILQTEATTLSVQLTLFQRDTTGLSTENIEIKLLLQAMEQQAQLRDALNEALKKEVERLKVATGEMMTPTDSYNFGMHHVPNTPFPIFPHESRGPGNTQNMQMPQFYPVQSNMSNPHQPSFASSQSHALSETLQQEHLGRLQGLDISSSGSHLVNHEGPSISASQSSGTF